jgi:hypothetical protein
MILWKNGIVVSEDRAMRTTDEVITATSIAMTDEELVV